MKSPEKTKGFSALRIRSPSSSTTNSPHKASSRPLEGNAPPNPSRYEPYDSYENMNYGVDDGILHWDGHYSLDNAFLGSTNTPPSPSCVLYTNIQFPCSMVLSLDLPSLRGCLPSKPSITLPSPTKRLFPQAKGRQRQPQNHQSPMPLVQRRRPERRKT